MKIGAIAAGIRQKEKGVVRRRRSPSEEELASMTKKEHTAISDIDIRENTKTRLRFRKLPWTEWLLGLAFLAGLLFILGFLHFNNVSKIS